MKNNGTLLGVVRNFLPLLLLLLLQLLLQLSFLLLQSPATVKVTVAVAVAVAVTMLLLLLTGSGCTLSGGESVGDGWSGNDSGSNSCNTCHCNSGGLACTKMFCGELPTPHPPTRTRALSPFQLYCISTAVAAAYAKANAVAKAVAKAVIFLRMLLAVC